jgi:hypothetical protein
MRAVTGAPEELADHLRKYARAGVTQVQVFLDPDTTAAVETFGRTLDLLDRGAA